MSKIADSLNKLKTAIVGTVTSKIDNSLDNAVKDISLYKSQSGRNGYIDLVKSLVSKYGDTNLLQMMSVPGSGTTPAMFGQGARILRYKTYDSIVYNISYCYRALSVLTDNILSPDDVTKNSLEIVPISFLEDEVETQSKAELAKEVSKRLKIDNNIDKIVFNTLKYGDFFCEIGDAKTAMTSRAFLVEYAMLHQQSDLCDTLNFVIDKQDFQIKMDYSSFSESKEEEKETTINDIKLMFHDPKLVVKLQSELFPICFGYLIFPKYVANPQTQLTDQAVNNICMSIIKSLQKKIPDIKELENNKDLKDVITNIIKDSDYSKGLNIRYVPDSRMQHFSIGSNKYYPYGESIFDSVQFLSKVLIALETALTINRLARSTEKRKITYEIGLPRDAKKSVEAIKEQLRKRKISLDSFGTVDTIPSMITTFEDVYLPQKDGKSFVDIATFNEGNVDIRNKVDELRFMRDSIVASLSVPPALIGIEENSALRSTLSQENVIFARTIVKHQKCLSPQVSELFYKIFLIVYPDEALTLLDNISITFPAPKTLHFEMNAKRISDIISLIQNLEQIGVSKEYSKKKFLPELDWDEIKHYDIDEKIDKTLGTEREDYGSLSGGMGAIGGIPSMNTNYGGGVI